MLYEGLVGSCSHLHFPIPRRRCINCFYFAFLALVFALSIHLHRGCMAITLMHSSHGVLCDTVLLLHFFDIFILVFCCGHHPLHSDPHTLYPFPMSDWV